MRAGQNTVRTITAVTANGLELTLNSSLSTALTSNSRYTFGPHVVDEFGKITGVFDIPETETDNFTAGQRVFMITDTATSTDNGYLMRSTAFYNALGAPQIVYPPPPPHGYLFLQPSVCVPAPMHTRSTCASEPVYWPWQDDSLPHQPENLFPFVRKLRSS